MHYNGVNLSPCHTRWSRTRRVKSRSVGEEMCLHYFCFAFISLKGFLTSIFQLDGEQACRLSVRNKFTKKVTVFTHKLNIFFLIVGFCDFHCWLIKLFATGVFDFFSFFFLCSLLFLLFIFHNKGRWSLRNGIKQRGHWNDCRTHTPPIFKKKYQPTVTQISSFIWSVYWTLTQVCFYDELML